MQKSTSLNILFFGSVNCELTQKAIGFLKSQNFEVTEYLTTYEPAANKQSLLTDVVKEWTGEYIVCFKSLFLVPEWLISKASVAAINFHPASVEFPGRGCINFAIHENSPTYGVTVHIINDSGIDSGPILECRRFPIFKNDDFYSIFHRAQAKMMDQYFDFFTGIIQSGKKHLDALLELSRHEKWNGSHRKISDLNQMLTVDHTTSKVDLEKVIHASDLQNKPPKIYLHGYGFSYDNGKKNTELFEQAKKGF